MNLRRVGVACSIGLLATGLCLGPGCGDKTIVEIINPSGDAGEKSPGADGSSLAAGDDAAVFDATVGATDSGSNNTPVDSGSSNTSVDSGTPVDGGPSDTDAPSTFVSVDAGCPGPDLRCHVDTCSGPGTSVSGTVYDPAGNNPIPHAFVFVPTDPGGAIPAIVPGARTCDSCSLPIGSYVAATTSDATGSFSLDGVPTGTHVPIVVQIGKWRREVFVSTTSCQNTVLPASDTHLPASRAQGDMPAMALLTGGLDDLGCFLFRMGIEAGEYTSPHAGGRVDVYQGLGLGGASGPGLSNGTAGNCTNTSCPLWSSKGSLESYDIVLLACEGDTFDATEPADAGLAGMVSGGSANVTSAGKQAMHDWLGEGGKVFATHFHYTWFMNGPADFQGVASWKGYSLGTGTGSDAIVTTFPKGQDFRTELADAGALQASGNLALTGLADSVATVNPPTLGWIRDPSTTDTKYLTFTTPVGGTCGKAAFSDLHAGGAPSGNIPGACASQALSAQEKAMELLFFDLSACVSDDSMAPPGPPASQ
jgi:hypothetical protein